MNWFYIDESIQKGDRRTGPLDFEDLQALKRDGKIGDSTLVWHKGLAGWISYKEATETAARNSNAEIEQKLKETVEELLRERVEKQGTKSYAGFFIRGAALILDNFIISLLWELGANILDRLSLVRLESIASSFGAIFEKYAADPLSAGISDEFLAIPGMTELFLLWFIIQTLYFVCFNGFLSATPGKLLLRLRIERADGSPLRFSGALVRYLFSLLTQATMIFYGIGYILALIDPQKRALHDFFARTRVVRIPRKIFSDRNSTSKD